jgi:hypothetical protein
VRRAVAGQARAGTTAQERFGAVLHNTEEIIGTALLPTLNKYLNSLARWLTKMNESGRLQHDVERTTKALTTAIHDVSTVAHGAADGFNVFAHAVGGAKKALELLAVAFGVLKAKAILSRSGLLSGITGIGTAAEKSRGRVAGLGAALGGLPETIAVTLLITELISQKQKDQAIGAVNKTLGGFAFGPGEKARDGEIRDFGNQKFIVKTIGGQQFLVPLPQKNPLRGQRFSPFGAPRAAATIPQSASGAAAGPTLTPAQQRAINLSAQPNNLVFLRAQEAFDKKSIELLTARFKSGQIGAKKFKDASSASTTI